MKRVLFPVLAIIGIAMALFSCQQAPFITMTGPRSFTFTRDGGTQSISFTCNRDWSVSSSESWIQVSPSSGTANGGTINVTIICSPNTTYDSRSATLTVRVEELMETISITQDTGIGLIISPKSLNVSNAAQIVEVDVQKNVQYSVSIDDAGSTWITYMGTSGGTKGLSSEKAVFSIAANTTYDDRRGVVSFKSNEGNLVEMVSITQETGLGIVVTPSTVELSNAAQSFEILVQKNVEYSVSIDDVGKDWITFTGTKSLSSEKATFSVSANETYDAREGKIIFTQINGPITETIVVHQSQNNGLFVSPESFTLSFESQEIEVEIKHNVEFEVSIPSSGSWISIIDGTKALETNKKRFSIQKNDSFESREASISFKQKEGDLSVTVLVKQAGKIPVESIVLNKSNLKLIEDESETLVATVKPDNATDKNVDWSSSDSRIASVDQKGLVTAIKEGSAIITAKAGEKQTTCSVVVERDITKATSLSINGEALYVAAGKSYSLSASVTPEDARCDFSWSSSNTNAVSVSGMGLSATISSIRTTTGYFTITVTDRRTGLSASIKVYNFIENFAWNVSSDNTYQGDPLIILPVEGTYQLKYTSSAGSNVLNIFGNPADIVFYEGGYVADTPENITLSPDGLVTGIKEGVTGLKTTGGITSGGKRVYFKVASSISESEYNDTKDYANSVPYKMPMVFSLLNTSDVDWFKLQSPSSFGNITATISVEFLNAASLPDNQRRLCKYSLYDSTMQLWGAGSFSFSKTETIASTRRTVPAGPLYLKVYFDTSYSSDLLPLGSMKLSMTIE